MIEWLEENPDYRLSDDESNVDTLQSWIFETQGLSWTDYVEKMSQPRVWGDEVNRKPDVGGHFNGSGFGASHIQ